MGHLDILREAFGDRLVVSIAEAAALLGWHPQSIRNAISKGRWPTPTVKVGGKVSITVASLAALTGGTMEAAQPAKPTTQPPKQKRGPGRPPKKNLELAR